MREPGNTLTMAKTSHRLVPQTNYTTYDNKDDEDVLRFSKLPSPPGKRIQMRIP